MLMLTPTEDELYVMNEMKKCASRNSVLGNAWIITAQTLYPKNFLIQFEVYKMEKEYGNHIAAAKVFNYLMATFEKEHYQLWLECDELSCTLLTPDNELKNGQEFYVRMFEHLNSMVQDHLFKITVNDFDNSLYHCKTLISLLKRHPKALRNHASGLLQMVITGRKTCPQKYQELLIEEILPFYYHKKPDIPSKMICRMFTLSLEYYIKQIIEDNLDTNECWKKIFQALTLCGQIQRWHPFLPFNKNWGQNVYWEKLYEIVSISSPGSIQVLYYGTTLFLYSLHCYIRNCNTKVDDQQINYVLVEGLTTLNIKSNDRKRNEPPQISLTTSLSKDLSKAFVHAAQCWQLLNTEQFHCDFSKLLIRLPLSSWISRFLFDLAMYFGHTEEAKSLMEEMTIHSALVYNILKLTLDLLQNCLTLEGFEAILKILIDLPPTQGQLLDHLTLQMPRHMLFIPLTQKALVQYCTGALISFLRIKLYSHDCNDHIMSALLILLQLEYPRENEIVEHIFSKIVAQRSFTFPYFGRYLATADFIEELMYLSNTISDIKYIFASNKSEMSYMSNVKFAPIVGSTIPTMNSTLIPTTKPSVSTLISRRRRSSYHDRNISCVREDLRPMFKQQTLRCNDNIFGLVSNFILNEQMQLISLLFIVKPVKHENDQ